MSRQEALQQFRQALKAGQKCYRECVHRGRYPYPQVLEERLRGCAAAEERSPQPYSFWVWILSRVLSSFCPCLFAPIALFSANLRYISIKSPFLTRILTHSLYYGNRMQHVCPTSAALFRCGCGDSKNKRSLRQKRRRRTTTKSKEERT